jgi:hypothetical protein
MKSPHRHIKLKFILVLLYSCITMACGPDLKDIEGRYYGKMVVAFDQQPILTKVFLDATSRRDSVSINLYQSPSNQLLDTVTLKKTLLSRDEQIRIDSNMLGGRRSVKVEIEGTCATASPDQDLFIDTCFSGESFTLTIKDSRTGKTINLQASKSGWASNNELPAGQYSLQQLAVFTKKNNIDTLIKAERVYQAREEMLLRRGNMFPNFNLGTILNSLEGPLAFASQIGNILPFLFPDNWLRLKAGTLLYHGELWAYKSFRANQLLILEGMYNLLLRDRNYSDLIKKHFERTQKIEALVVALAQQGEIPRPWVKLARLKVLEINEDQINIRKYLRQQNLSLQKLIGFTPNRQLISLIPLAAPKIDSSVIQDLSAAEVLALNDSLEIKQLQHLEQAARQLTKAAKWSWLNPNTDPRFNMGLGWRHAINIERANIKIFSLRQRDVEYAVHEQIINIEGGIEDTVDQYSYALEGLDAAQAAYDASMAMFQESEISIFGVFEIAEELFKYQAKKRHIESTYLMLIAKLDRLMLRGLYRLDDL